MERVTTAGVVATVVAVVLVACTGTGDGEDPVAGPSGPTSPAASSAPVATPSPRTRPSPTPEASATPPDREPTATPTVETGADDRLTDDRLTDAELAALGVNELGRVLVGEWHVIGDTDGEYRTSRATFRRQLTELYDRGYRPVTQQEFRAGTFPIPAGTSPVVLTFDDSTRGQLALDDDGEPAADTAVGILEEFAADHPGWRATAVFAFNFPDPFGDPEVTPRLRWLVDHGYELSNHTVGHVDLSGLSGVEVVANLAENQTRLHEVVPDAPLPSITLPLGKWPDDREAAVAGTAADGTSYRHELVYLVGSDPTRSPHHVEFDPAAIQRVPAHAVVGTGPEWFWDWLDRLDDEELRFVSDGRSDVVTIPAGLAEVADVDPSFETRTYGTP